MSRPPHLFRVGPCTYAICGVTMHTAYAYMREILHVKPDQYKYLGEDKRAPQQQYDSFTIGVDARGFKPTKLLSLEEQELERRYQEEKDARPKTTCPWCKGTGTQ